MTREKFVRLYLTPDNGSTVATRKATPQDIRAAQPSSRVDYHVELATEKE